MLLGGFYRGLQATGRVWDFTATYRTHGIDMVTAFCGDQFFAFSDNRSRNIVFKHSHARYSRMFKLVVLIHVCDSSLFTTIVSFSAESYKDTNWPGELHHIILLSHH
jgi:hypothetical protein